MGRGHSALRFLAPPLPHAVPWDSAGPLVAKSALLGNAVLRPTPVFILGTAGGFRAERRFRKKTFTSVI